MGYLLFAMHVLGIRYALEKKTYVVPTSTEVTSQTNTNQIITVVMSVIKVK